MFSAICAVYSVIVVNYKQLHEGKDNKMSTKIATMPLHVLYNVGVVDLFHLPIVICVRGIAPSNYTTRVSRSSR